MNSTNRANICIDCEKACGGCSWSKDFTPVPGWTATPVVRRVWTKLDKKKIVHNCETYSITACPLFERTKPRKDIELGWFKLVQQERREREKAVKF